MPPINQQGSRTPLITALVVFVILFVVSLVFAFSYYGRWQQSEVNFDTYKKQYTTLLPESAIATPDVIALGAAKQETPAHFGIFGSLTAMDVALKQRNGLQALIAGPGADLTPAAAADASATEVKTDADALKGVGANVDLATGGLDGALHRLTIAYVNSQKQVASLKTDVAARETALKAATASIDQMTQANAAATADAKKKADDQVAALQDSFSKNTDAMNAMTAAQAAAGKTAADQATQQSAQLTEVQGQLKKAQSDIEQLHNRLAYRRPYVDDAAIRVADGQLIRVPGNNVCYINLGYGSGVTTGMTFEVYDKLSGVPPLPPNLNGDEQLPVGKASIEIIHVGQNSSECRIVHTEPGAVLVEGDLIENLVYDAHQKYNFCVYGNFDLGNTGRPVAADAEVIKRLVTQWGGKLIDHISPNTDFLVIGAEPVLPEFSKDDLTPENQKKLQDAQDALEKYQEIRQQAKDLHIPVLNQNRFLYYVGYYDQATR
jgi:hypothetical protein